MNLSPLNQFEPTDATTFPPNTKNLRGVCYYYLFIRWSVEVEKFLLYPDLLLDGWI